MKGKIYKNRLSSANPIDQQLINESILINQLYQRSPSPKSSFNPINQYQHQQSFIRDQPIQKNEKFHRSPDKTIINNLFGDTNYGRMQQSRENTILLQQKPSIIDKFGGLSDNNQYASQISKRMLKRVVSNPDFNIGQENVQIVENSLLNNKTNSRTILSPKKINSKNTPLKGYSRFGPNENYKNNNKRTIIFDNQLSNMNTYPLNGDVSGHFQTNLYNPLPQASNFYYQNEQNSSIRMPLTSDYIVSYQKRHKQRLTALQSQHELQMQFLEQQIKSRDDLISDMKRMLKQKEQIIKKLQSQNASLSSRSYASFANGNYGNRQ